MKKILKHSVSNLNHLKIIGGIVFEVIKLGVKSYLSKQLENSKIESKGKMK